MYISFRFHDQPSPCDMIVATAMMRKRGDICWGLVIRHLEEAEPKWTSLFHLLASASSRGINGDDSGIHVWQWPDLSFFISFLFVCASSIEIECKLPLKILKQTNAVWRKILEMLYSKSLFLRFFEMWENFEISPLIYSDFRASPWAGPKKDGHHLGASIDAQLRNWVRPIYAGSIICPARPGPFSSRIGGCFWCCRLWCSGECRWLWR